MMMRRFRRSFGRRRRPPMQWVPQVAAVVPGAGAAVTAVTLVDAASGFSGTTQPQPTIGRMTVQRVVGEIETTFQNGTEQYHFGIIVVDSGQTTVSLPDPSLQAGLDAPWLWLGRFFSETNSGLLTNQTYSPNGNHIDVRVKRVLRPNERLLLVCSSTTAAGSGYNVWLRTLISRVA